MLEMNGVTKTFGSFKALDNLTLTVPQGAVYGLVGPNGAGKSTAIRHLTGIYRPDAGTVTIAELYWGENADRHLPAGQRHRPGGQPAGLRKPCREG